MLQSAGSRGNTIHPTKGAETGECCSKFLCYKHQLQNHQPPTFPRPYISPSPSPLLPSLMGATFPLHSFALVTGQRGASRVSWSVFSRRFGKVPCPSASGCPQSERPAHQAEWHRSSSGMSFGRLACVRVGVICCLRGGWW